MLVTDVEDLESAIDYLIELFSQCCYDIQANENRFGRLCAQEREFNMYDQALNICRDLKSGKLCWFGFVLEMKGLGMLSYLHCFKKYFPKYVQRKIQDDDVCFN